MSQVIVDFLNYVSRLFPEWMELAKSKSAEILEDIRRGNPAYEHWGSEKLMAGFVTRSFRELKGFSFDCLALTNKEIADLLVKSRDLDLDDAELRFRIQGIVGDNDRFLQGQSPQRNKDVMAWRGWQGEDTKAVPERRSCTFAAECGFTFDGNMSTHNVTHDFIKLIERLFPELLDLAKARAIEMEERIRQGNQAYLHWGAEKLAAGFITRSYREEKGFTFSVIALTDKEIEDLIKKSKDLGLDDKELRFRIRGIVGDKDRFQ